VRGFGIFTFGIFTLIYGSIWDFYVRDFYVRDYFIQEKFVAPLLSPKSNIFEISYNHSHKGWNWLAVTPC
jgi:hypothetical protein